VGGWWLVVDPWPSTSFSLFTTHFLLFTNSGGPITAGLQRGLVFLLVENGADRDDEAGNDVAGQLSGLGFDV
ncbi:MAG: hypothetical protein R6X32_12520, partial [Chloroflexota bacterium]